EDVAAAVGAAREAFENGWSALAGSERAKYLFRIARVLSERSREFAVLESLNGGKPIKESRDVDVPLAAAHFFYYAGWADKLVDAEVDKLAFTGSTEVGKAIQRRIAGSGKRLTLELGGKAANIVFDDCALDQAVEGIVNGIYFNQGHVCCAGSRLLVQESIYE